MIQYLKLVHFELTRFRWIYLSLFVVTLLSQFAGLYFHAQNTIGRIHERMVAETLTEAEYIMRFGQQVGFSNFTLNNIWFMGPIALCITALLLYVFLIWYRDWLGKNMFIYRLLMLPTSRSNIFLAKLSAIVLMVWGLIAFQMLLLPLLNRLYNSIVPSVYRYSLPLFDVIITHPILQILMPRTFIEFVLYYGAGIMGVIVIFTVILLERSYRWKGLLAGIAYGAVACITLLLPWVISEEWFSNYLYPIELLAIGLIVGLFIIGISLRLSFFLLNKKVNV
jgi:hypothetical protein